MCGIVGIYYFASDRTVVKEDLQAMAERIVHRGPDDAGFHVDGNLGMGMRRLSIIDVSGGHQPIFTPDGRYVIVFNGEVYNFKEERAKLERAGHRFRTHTDTEVVLHLYAEHGIEFLETLNGMFGLAVWDRVERSLLIVRDRIGIKPLYYYLDDEKLIFASEIKAILAYPEVRPELDLEGLGGFLRYGFTPSPSTLFKGIKKLRPAHWLMARAGEIREREYWRLSYREKFALDESELAERLYALLSDSVRLQMIADVPLGAFLSGGFDSSGIVHLMNSIDSKPINTYSIGFGKGFEAYNELEAAGRFSRDYETSHHEILVRPDVEDLLPRLVAAMDEPVADSSFLVTYLVAELAHDTVSVVLSGVGGDELFGGYRRYLNVPLAGYMQLVPSGVRQGLLLRVLNRMPVDRNSRLLNLSRLARAYLETAHLPLEEQYGRYTLLFDENLADELARQAGLVPDHYSILFEECDSSELLDRMMYFDLKMSLPEQLLMLTDKMTMAASVETRVPFLDHRVVEFAARTPARIKIRGMKLRHLQKRAFRGRLPDYVYEQRKKGFGAPVGVWLRRELRPLVDELLRGPYLQRQGIFNLERVTSLVEDHYLRRADYTDQLLSLIVFQLWFQAYGLS